MSDTDIALSAYVDGELDAAETQRIEARIAADPMFAARVQQMRETTSLLRAACAESFYTDPMAHLLLPPQRLRWRERRRLIGVLAACFAAAFIGFGAGSVTPGFLDDKRGHMVSEIAEYHEVYSRESARLAELGPDRSDELLAWLGERVNRRLIAPDLSPAGLTFAGGRMLVLNGKPVADLLYTRNHGLPVALCVIASDEKPSDLRVETRGPQRVATWTDGRHMFIVVGEISVAKAKRLADMVAPQLGS